MTDTLINELVATKVMHWRSMGDAWATGPTTCDRVGRKTKHAFATDMTRAWTAVMEIASDVEINVLNNQWRVSLPEYNVTIWAETAPRALCLAVLKAVGV